MSTSSKSSKRPLSAGTKMRRPKSTSAAAGVTGAMMQAVLPEDKRAVIRASPEEALAWVVRLVALVRAAADAPRARLGGFSSDGYTRPTEAQWRGIVDLARAFR